MTQPISTEPLRSYVKREVGTLGGKAFNRYLDEHGLPRRYRTYIYRPTLSRKLIEEMCEGFGIGAVLLYADWYDTEEHNPQHYLDEMDSLVEYLDNRGGWHSYRHIAECLGRSVAWVMGRYLEAERRGLVAINRWSKPFRIATLPAPEWESSMRRNPGVY